MVGLLVVQGIISGMCLGGTYILLGLGMTLILSVMNILQFSHGQVYMVGAFTVYYLTVKTGMNIYLAVPIAMVTTSLLGLFLERFFLRPIKGDFLGYVLVTSGLGIIMEVIVVAIFGLGVKQVPSLCSGSIEVGGMFFAKDRLIALLISAVLVLVLQIFLKRSKFGLALTASAQNPEGAILQGINPNVMSALVVAIGSGIAAVGGALGGSIFNLDPYMGGAAFGKGIALIVIGGLGSVMGTVVGGIMLGLSDYLIALFFGSQVASAIPLCIVVIFLLFRPRGLFGHD